MHGRATTRGRLGPGRACWVWSLAVHAVVLVALLGTQGRSQPTSAARAPLSADFSFAAPDQLTRPDPETSLTELAWEWPTPRPEWPDGRTADGDEPAELPEPDEPLADGLRPTWTADVHVPLSAVSGRRARTSSRSTQDLADPPGGTSIERAPRPPPDQTPAAAPTERPSAPSRARAPVARGGTSTPLRVVFAPDPRAYFPRGARRDGTVLVQLTISPRGEVTHASVVGSSGDRALDAAAVRLARAYRFAAGTRARRTRLPVVFRITRS